MTIAADIIAALFSFFVITFDFVAAHAVIVLPVLISLLIIIVITETRAARRLADDDNV